MKAFDILLPDTRFVDGRLLIENLPIRDGLTIYSRLEPDCELVKNIISAMYITPSGNLSGIVLDANAESFAEKYEAVNATPVVLTADIMLSALYCIQIQKQSLELCCEIREILRQYTGGYTGIAVGVNDSVEIASAKSSGRIYGGILPDIAADIAKICFENPDNICCLGAAIDDMTSAYNETISNIIIPGAYVKSLSYLQYLRVIQNNMLLGAAVEDIDIYLSIGKSYIRTILNAAADFTEICFTDSESALELTAQAEAVSNKNISTEAGVIVNAECAADLRRLRLLYEVDSMGTFADIGELTLEEIAYTDI